MTDIREIVVQLRAQASDRAVQRATGAHRQTVKHYRQWATEQGLLTGALPDLEALQTLVHETLGTIAPPQTVSSVEPYRQQVVKLRLAGVEVAAIWERLKEQGYTGSYSSVYRFVRQMEPHQPTVVVRVERPVGEEAQVDFGYAGRMLDPQGGQLRKAWGFVMTLSWSRHQYAEFVWDQSVSTWLVCHRRAFEFFGGVPQRVVIDNLKAAITHACWDDPQVQLSYRECAEHYGFLIAPCRPATPQHKGKVEKGGVHYLKRNFLAGRVPTTLAQANADVRRWCLTTAGRRVHGTTKACPLDRFEQSEQAHLRPLPASPYDPATWKVAKLHRDGYVVFAQSYYSAPFRFVGQSLRVRGGAQQVRLYTLDYHLVASHERAVQPGTRTTHTDHLPPEKVAALTLDRENLPAAADAIGPATAQVVAHLLSDRILDRVPTARRVVTLTRRYAAVRVEAACARALRFDDPTYATVKRILAQGLEQLSEPPPVREAPAGSFIRSARELVGYLFSGGAPWN